MSILAVCLVLSLAAIQEPQRIEVPVSADSVLYRFENERFVMSRIELRLDGEGEGTLAFTRKGVARPVERVVRIRPEVMAEIKASLLKLDFVGSTEGYQGKSDHPNLGTVTIGARRDGREREVSFNYTENHEMESLVSTLRGLANREIYAFDLETTARYQPLDTPNLIKNLKDDIIRRRVADPKSLVRLLRDLANDMTIPLIARNRATELADQIEKEKVR